MKKFLSNYKSTIILLVAIIVGAVIGIVFKEKATVLQPLGDIFLNLLLVIIVPLIFLTITTSIAKMQQPKRLGKIIGTIVLVFIFTSIIALLVGFAGSYFVKLVEPEDGKTIRDMLEQVEETQESEEETLIILEINKQISELANYRKISFDLIWWNESGLKVPNQAIVEENGLNYVVRNRAGYLDKILVNVTRKNDKYSIVTNYGTDELKNLGFSSTDIQKMKSISIYDEIILNPDLSKVN